MALLVATILCKSTLAQSNQEAVNHTGTQIIEKESQAYKEWYEAWARKEYLDAVDLAISYLQEYPAGKYEGYLKKTLKRPADCDIQTHFLPEAIGALLDSGGNVNVRMKDSKSPLMLAVIDGNTEVMKTLVQRGADVNAQESSYERSALTYAIWTANQAAILFLVNSGADTRLKDRGGRTPLDDALALRNPEIINMLR